MLKKLSFIKIVTETIRSILEFNFNAVLLTAFVLVTKGLKLLWKR